MLLRKGVALPPQPLRSDAYIRWGKNNKYSGKLVENGWFVHDFTTGETISSFNAHNSSFNQSEYTRVRLEAEEENEKRYRDIANRALEVWKKATEVKEHPYLTIKQVEAFGIRQIGQWLIIPIIDIAGMLWSLQFISADKQYAKRFFKGGKKKGCFHTIGNVTNSNECYIVEGYATGASVHMATGKTVIVAFDAGNLESVCSALKQQYTNHSFIIAADNDHHKSINTGKIKAEDVSRKLGISYVLPVFSEDEIVQYQSEGKGIPTDWNDTMQLGGIEIMKEKLLEPLEGNHEHVTPFRVTSKGVYYQFLSKDGKHNEKWLCSPLHITAYTHDEYDVRHGRILEWKSHNGTKHQWVMPCSLLAGDGQEIFKRLLDEGLEIASGRFVREKIIEYIQTCKPSKHQLCLSQIGWHESSFALPDVVFPLGCEKVLQTESHHVKAFQSQGTLEEWQHNVASLAVNNSRLMFALCVAFSAPLLAIAKEDSFIFHFMGSSSRGKTTALQVAASVWGGGNGVSYIQQWRATSNALEAIAENHRDCLLVLDEMGQADSKTIGDAVYMLANNQGKGRLSSSSQMRKSYMWRVVVLSSGEISLDEKLEEANKKAKAGMNVRCITIPAEVEGSFGVFEDLHGFSDGAAFARHIKEDTLQYYGTPIRAFLSHIVPMKDKLLQGIQDLRKDFLQSVVPSGADGQVKRVAERFAHVAAAGELAISLNILPFSEGEAKRACELCFKDWVQLRGSFGSAEIDAGISQIRASLEKYGASKFITLNTSGDRDTSFNPPQECWGFRKLEDGAYHYYLHSIGYNALCKGYNQQPLTRALVEAKYIERKDGKNQVLASFPGAGRKRYYHIIPEFLNQEEK